MSFSSELKEELGEVFDTSRHCRLAEIAAILCFDGETKKDDRGNVTIKIEAENPIAVNAFCSLLRLLFHTECSCSEKKSSRNLLSYSALLEKETAQELAAALKIGEEMQPDIGKLVEKSCCCRAFLRGAFLCAGSVSDPDRHYHFEIPCRQEKLAKQLISILKKLHLDGKLVERQKHFVVYIKDSTQISDLLGMMGARTGLLDMENARIRREVRGNINRRVNCETANINKAAQAAANQIEDIRYIDETIGISSLPERLDEMARIRLKYPEIPLSELGSYLEPPVGKSGVNHRLRKIGAIANKLRDQGGELL